MSKYAEHDRDELWREGTGASQTDGWTEQNVYESCGPDGEFDWDYYQYLCDVSPDYDPGD